MSFDIFPTLIQAFWLIIPIAYCYVSYQASQRHPGSGPSLMTFGAGLSLLSAIGNYYLNIRMSSGSVDYNAMEQYYPIMRLVGMVGQGLFVFGLYTYIQAQSNSRETDRLNY